MTNPCSIAPQCASKVAAAQSLGVSVRTIGNLIRTGQLPSVKIGRRRLIPIGALTEFIAQRKTGGERDT